MPPPSWKSVWQLRRTWSDSEEIGFFDKCRWRCCGWNWIRSGIIIWRTFFQTGSTYISALDWVIPIKFGLHIDFDLLKTATSPTPKPEVKLRCCSRHLKNRYDICFQQRIVLRIWIKFHFGIPIENEILTTMITVEIETGRIIPIWRTFVFPNRKDLRSNISDVDWCRRNLICIQILAFSCYASTRSAFGVLLQKTRYINSLLLLFWREWRHKLRVVPVLRRRGCHLENR